jgi:hypothetical protein
MSKKPPRAPGGGLLIHARAAPAATTVAPSATRRVRWEGRGTGSIRISPAGRPENPAKSPAAAAWSRRSRRARAERPPSRKRASASTVVKRSSTNSTRSPFSARRRPRSAAAVALSPSVPSMWRGIPSTTVSARRSAANAVKRADHIIEGAALQGGQRGAPTGPIRRTRQRPRGDAPNPPPGKCSHGALFHTCSPQSNTALLNLTLHDRPGTAPRPVSVPDHRRGFLVPPLRGIGAPTSAT